MKNLLSYERFSDFLRDEFEERRNRNYRYSIRSFARDAGISASRLSEVLNGDAISLSSAQKICTRLAIDHAAAEHLLDLVRLHSAVSKRRDSSSIAQRVSNRQTTLGFKTEFSEDLLSEWYLISVLEFLTSDEALTEAQIAERLGLSEREIRAARESLLRLGYLKRRSDGQYTKSSEFLKIENKSSVAAIQNYHRRFLAQAEHALGAQTIDERHFQTFLFTLSADDMSAAKADLDRFTADFVSRYSNRSGVSERLHVLGLQLFAVDKFKA